MTGSHLHILLAAPSGPDTDRLEALLADCRYPAMKTRVVRDLEAATEVASGASFDLLILHVRLVEGLSRGVLVLSPSLHALPIVLLLDAAAAAEEAQPLPEGVMDYITYDIRDVHAMERLLYYASQRYAMLRSLRDAEAQLRGIVERMSDGILVLDGVGEVLFANPAAEGILSRPLHEMLGAPVGFSIPESGAGTVEVLSHRHEPLQLEVRSHAVRWEDRSARLVTFRDVTAQSAMEENLRRSKEDAERTANMKTAFLANMSHELRMPLASIIGFAQLIRDGIEDSDYREFAESIIQGGNRLLETITSVLDLTRLDADAVRAQARLVGATSVAREAVGMLGALSARKKITVQVQEAEEDDTVLADPTILRRVLNNLVGNAIKFTDHGSVDVIIEADTEIVQIHVVDTGRGISEEFMSELFDEFTQESSGYDRSHEGSGLGLAITKRLCRLIGARIDVHSEKGVGSTFTVTIPHAETPEHED